MNATHETTTTHPPPGGGVWESALTINDHPETPGSSYSGVPNQTASRYRGLPVVFLLGRDGEPKPCPFLLSRDELVQFFRMGDVRFPAKAIERYRRLGLRAVKIGRRRWFALPDVLDFLDRQQSRLGAGQ